MLRDALSCTQSHWTALSSAQTGTGFNCCKTLYRCRSGMAHGLGLTKKTQEAQQQHRFNIITKKCAKHIHKNKQQPRLAISHVPEPIHAAKLLLHTKAKGSAQQYPSACPKKPSEAMISMQILTLKDKLQFPSVLQTLRSRTHFRRSFTNGWYNL